jgi:hypothetical protein
MIRLARPLAAPLMLLGASALAAKRLSDYRVDPDGNSPIPIQLQSFTSVDASGLA